VGSRAEPLPRSNCWRSAGDAPAADSSWPAAARAWHQNASGNAVGKMLPPV